jgi:hypothetical protein
VQSLAWNVSSHSAVQELPFSYGNRMFVAVFIKAFNWNISEPVLHIAGFPRISSSKPRQVIPSDLAFRPYFCPHVSFLHAIYMPLHFILLEFITLIILREVYRLRSSSLCSFLHYFTTFSLTSKYILIVLFQKPSLLRFFTQYISHTAQKKQLFVN